MSHKYVVSALVLLALIVLTAATIFGTNDLEAVALAIGGMKIPWLILGIGTALAFVALEGVMIWYLLRSLRADFSPRQCIGWSFIGFFFSAITPSATGGQPMQIYYMKRGGVKLSESTPILMIVAVLYKFTLVLIGIGILLFWPEGLAASLGGFLWLFYLGLGLNIAMVFLLVFVMVCPALARKVVLGLERLLVAVRILKKSEHRQEKLCRVVAEYQTVVDYFKGHKKKIFVVSVMTFAQRCMAFLMIWIVYRGLGLTAMGILPLMAMQAAVTIAVDLLPLPGSAGITELVSAAVFTGVFSGELLAASLCISRGISFYLVLLVSAAVLAGMHFSKPKANANQYFKKTNHKGDAVA